MVLSGVIGSETAVYLIAQSLCGEASHVAHIAEVAEDCLMALYHWCFLTAERCMQADELAAVLQ
jgi:hypothetical protein